MGASAYPRSSRGKESRILLPWIVHGPWLVEQHGHAVTLLEVSFGEAKRHLKQGDSMAMLLDQPWTVHNPGQKDARFLTATAPRIR